MALMLLEWNEAMKKKKKYFTYFSQSTRLITDIVCSSGSEIGSFLRRMQN